VLLVDSPLGVEVPLTCPPAAPEEHPWWQGDAEALCDSRVGVGGVVIVCNCELKKEMNAFACGVNFIATHFVIT